jgi:membrane protease subunit HflC
VKIFADAYGRDPDFYQLVRTLEAYRKSIDEGTTVVLSPNSEFFRYLKQLDRPTDQVAPDYNGRGPLQTGSSPNPLGRTSLARDSRKRRRSCSGSNHSGDC